MKDLACRLLFGEVEGKAMHRRVEQAIGGSCPCFKGGTCPILNAENRSPLMSDEDEAIRVRLPLVPVQRVS